MTGTVTTLPTKIDHDVPLKGLRESAGGHAAILALIQQFGFWGDLPKIRERFTMEDDPSYFDAQAFAAVREKGGSGYRHAALFVLNVWHKCDDWPGFVLVDALASMDVQRRETVIAWCQDPWWS